MDAFLGVKGSPVLYSRGSRFGSWASARRARQHRRPILGAEWDGEARSGGVRRGYDVVRNWVIMDEA